MQSTSVFFICMAEMTNVSLWTLDTYSTKPNTVYQWDEFYSWYHINNENRAMRKPLKLNKHCVSELLILWIECRMQTCYSMRFILFEFRWTVGVFCRNYFFSFCFIDIFTCQIKQSTFVWVVLLFSFRFDLFGVSSRLSTTNMWATFLCVCQSEMNSSK